MRYGLSEPVATATSSESRFIFSRRRAPKGHDTSSIPALVSRQFNARGVHHLVRAIANLGGDCHWLAVPVDCQRAKGESLKDLADAVPIRLAFEVCPRVGEPAGGDIHEWVGGVCLLQHGNLMDVAVAADADHTRDGLLSDELEQPCAVGREVGPFLVAVLFGDDLGATDEYVDLCSALLERVGEPGSLRRAEELRVVCLAIVGEIAVVYEDDFDALPCGAEVVCAVDAFAMAARVVSWHGGEVECETLRDCFERIAGMRIVPAIVMVVPCSENRELLAKGGVAGLVELLLVFGCDHCGVL